MSVDLLFALNALYALSWNILLEIASFIPRLLLKKSDFKNVFEPPYPNFVPWAFRSPGTRPTSYAITCALH